MGFPRGDNADAGMSVAATAVDGAVTVALVGELAVPWAQAVHGRLVAIVDRHRTPVVALDLAGVDFCDAAGAGGWWSAGRQRRRHAQRVGQQQPHSG